MKWMIASDIHGSALWCRNMLAAFEREGADRLLLLGDLLYHGPRNDLPEEYDPKAVIAMLNGAAERILAVRGNCDSQVDQMVLRFPILAEYAVLTEGDRLLYAIHGHTLETSPLPLCPGDLLLCGHTHIPACEERFGARYCNPGSVAIPKENSPHGYLLLADGCLTWKDLETGAAYMQYAL